MLQFFTKPVLTYTVISLQFFVSDSLECTSAQIDFQYHHFISTCQVILSTLSFATSNLYYLLKHSIKKEILLFKFLSSFKSLPFVEFSKCFSWMTVLSVILMQQLLHYSRHCLS